MSRKQNYAQTRRNAVRGYRDYTWTEDVMIAAHSMSDRDLSQLIGRSVEAIQIRRSRLKAREA